MMKIFHNINFKSLKCRLSGRIVLKPLISLLALSPLFFSCTDDLSLNENNRGDSQLPEIDYENSLVIPLAVNMDPVSGRTREGSEPDSHDSNAGLAEGNSFDHEIDFGINNECFALFFDSENEEHNGNFMYLKPLYKNATLGEGVNPNDGVGEYQVYVMAYIDKPEGWDYKRGEEETDEDYEKNKTKHEQDRLSSLPGRILVVLNGGRIYKNLCQTFNINETTGESSGKYTGDDFLEYHWQYDLGNPFDEKDENDSRRLRVIGVNADGHYTMTNSAYYGPDDDYVFDEENKKWNAVQKNEDESNYKLQTIRAIKKENIQPALASNIVKENCAAIVFVERMVAKFSAPNLSTSIIGGEDKVIWPSQEAQTLAIWSYNKSTNTWNSEEKRWRVHLLGWTINGREKRSYLFKHIRDGWQKENSYTKKWKRTDWNQPTLRRSYWSIDPHYNYNQTREENGVPHTDFYPWQFRGAMDKNHISWSHQSNIDEEKNDIALRYLSFNEAKFWNEALTISENTFNPYYNEEDITHSISTLDTRGSLLMGPHLLLTAEIYLQNGNSSENEYVSNFETVQNLYCDRYYRYFTTEENMFRRFVYDINDALSTQKTITFKYFEWAEDVAGNDNPPTYEADPEGHVQLFFDLTLDEKDDSFLNNLTSEERATYKKLKDLDEDYYNKNNTHKYHLKEVSKVIDDLVSDNIKMSIQANIKDGDGRVLPWIPGIVFRQVANPENILAVKKKKATENDSDVPYTKWTDSMRKSLILERVGPIDHYYQGYMYYAADIPHHIIDKDTKEGYYGAVRNHWYTFTVTAINSIGTPVDDPNQRIIPTRYKYRDQMSVYCEPGKWHFIGEVSVGFTSN